MARFTTKGNEPVGKLFSCVRPLYERPLVIARAGGCHVFDESGAAFLDAYAGVASVAVGHSHPRVIAAVKAQLDQVAHTTMLYQTRPLLDYVAAVQTVLPPDVNRHFFVNSGSEALDFACQTARAHRRKPVIVAFSAGFHGGSYLTKSITGMPAWRPAYGGDRNVHHHLMPMCRECIDMTPTGECRCTARCLDELDTLLGARTVDVAAVVIEPVFGVGGIMIPARPFFQRLDEICQRHAIDLIVDEVQTGFGRCGGAMFGFAKYGLHPDIVCMAKGIANGFPMGLVSARDEVAAAIGKTLHFSTFGGNPVSCAAALATLSVLRDEALPERAAREGEFCLHELRRQLRGHPSVVEIRGTGWLIGIELTDNAAAMKVLEGCYARHVLVGIGGPARQVVRIEPPLTFSREHVVETVAAVVAALDGRV